MQNETTIRPIRLEEAPEAKNLIYTIAHPLVDPQKTMAEFILMWEGWGVLDDMDDIQANFFDNGGVFLVVVTGGRIVGTGAIQRYTDRELFSENGRLHTTDESLRTGEGVCVVRRISLLPAHEGKKLGHLAYPLMMELTERARAMGYTKMVLWTNPITLHRAVDFYHRLGFTDLPIDNADPDELWLGKEI